MEILTDADLGKVGISPWCEGVFEGMHPCAYFTDRIGKFPAECRRKMHSPIPTKKVPLAGGGFGLVWPRCSGRPRGTVNAEVYKDTNHTWQDEDGEVHRWDPAGMER